MIQTLREINRTSALDPDPESFELQAMFTTEFSQRCVRFLIQKKTLRSPDQVRCFWDACSKAKNMKDGRREFIMNETMTGALGYAIDPFNEIFNADGFPGGGNFFAFMEGVQS